MPLQPEFGGEQVVLGLQQALNRARMSGQAKADPFHSKQLASFKAISQIQQDLRGVARGLPQRQSRSARVLPPRDARGRFTRRPPNPLEDARSSMLSRLINRLPLNRGPASLSLSAAPKDPVAIQVFLLRRAFMLGLRWTQMFETSQFRWQRRRELLANLMARRGNRESGTFDLFGLFRGGGGLLSKLGGAFAAALALPRLLGQFFGRSGSFLSGLWSRLSAWSKPLLGRASGAVGAAGRKIATKAGSAVSALKSTRLGSKAVELAGRAGAKIGSVASNFTGTLGKTGTKLLEAGLAISAISGRVMGVAGRVLSFGLKLVPFLGFGIDTLFDAKNAKGAGKGGMSLIMGALFGDTGKGAKAGAGDILGHAGGQALKWGALGLAFAGPVGAAVGAVLGGGIALIKDGLETGFLQRLWSNITSLTKPYTKAFIAIFHGLWRGVQRTWTWITSFMGNLVSDFWKNAKTKWTSGITYLQNQGGAFWDRIKSGVSGTVARSAALAQEKWTGFSTIVSSIISDIKTGIQSRIEGLISSFNSAVEGAKGIASSVSGKVTGILGKVGDKFNEVVTAVGVALSSFKLSSIWTSATNTVRWLAEKVKGFLSNIFSSDGPVMKALSTALQSAFDFFGGIGKFVTDAGLKVAGVVGRWISSGGQPAPGATVSTASAPARPVSTPIAPRMTSQDIRVLELQAKLAQEQRIERQTELLSRIADLLSRGGVQSETSRAITSILQTMGQASGVPSAGRQ